MTEAIKDMPALVEQLRCFGGATPETCKQAADVIERITQHSGVVKPVGYVDAEQFQRWDVLRGTEFESDERCYLPFSKIPFKSDLSDCSMPIYSAATVARLVFNQANTNTDQATVSQNGASSTPTSLRSSADAVAPEPAPSAASTATGAASVRIEKVLPSGTILYENGGAYACTKIAVSPDFGDAEFVLVSPTLLSDDDERYQIRIDIDLAMNHLPIDEMRSLAHFVAQLQLRTAA